jgi:hypothetical protein
LVAANSKRARSISAIATNYEVVAIGPVKAEDVKDDDAFGGVDDLANAKKRFAPGDAEKFGASRIGNGGVNFFVGVAEFDAVLAFKRGKK